MTKDVLDILMSKKSLMLWSVLSFIIPFALLYQHAIANPVTSIIVSILFLALALVAFFKAKQKLNMVGLSVVALSYLTLIFDSHFNLQTTQAGILQPTLFAILGIGLLMLFNIKLDKSIHNYKRLLIVLGASAAFALLFLLLNEPYPSFIKHQLLILIIYTFFVSLGEELVFRGAVFSTVRKTFDDEKALHVQAGIFTVVHLFSIGALYAFYDVNRSFFVSHPLLNVILYAGALYGFSLVAGKFAINGKKTNITYPLLFHWLVNFLNLVILL